MACFGSSVVVLELSAVASVEALVAPSVVASAVPSAVSSSYPWGPISGLFSVVKKENSGTWFGHRYPENTMAIDSGDGVWSGGEVVVHWEI